MHKIYHTSQIGIKGFSGERLAFRVRMGTGKSRVHGEVDSINVTGKLRRGPISISVK